MDFNNEVFVKNIIKRLRKELEMPNLQIWEAHEILNLCGINPTRKIPRENGGFNTPYYRKEVELLLNDKTRLMTAKRKFLHSDSSNNINYNNTIVPNNNSNGNTTTQISMIDKSPKHIFPNYYGNEEMGKESDNLLKQQEVWFDDEQDNKLYEQMFSKHYYFTESQIHGFEKRMLNESATDKFIDKLIFNNLPDSAKGLINTPVNTLVKEHPEALNGVALNASQEVLDKYGNLPLKDFIRISIMQMFDIGHGKGPKKYLRGIFRIMLDEIKCLRNPDMNAINKLKDDVMYIMQASENGTDAEAAQMDANLNGWSLNEIHSKFKEKRKAFFMNIRNKLSNAFKGGSNAPKYRKVVITSHDQCVKYAPYVGWCITFNSSANYDTYTQGGRRFYIFLREGFENVERKMGENCPFDDYGMSMVAVLVDMDGNISIITTRWNHEHDGEMSNPSQDKIETVMDLMGVNLYKECPPYTREELHKMGIVLFDEVQEMLDNGKKPKEVFDYVDDFNEGLARVRLNGKQNFIDKNGNLLLNQWFDYCWGFKEGFAYVRLKGKYNYIDKNSKLLSPNQWFNGCWSFHEGFGCVELNDKYNFIDDNGKILSPNHWFDGCWNFNEGLARVRLNGKQNFIDKNGNLLLNQWFDYVDDFQEGLALVKLNGKFNYIDKNGNLYDVNKQPLNEGKRHMVLKESDCKDKKILSKKDKEYAQIEKCFDFKDHSNLVISKITKVTDTICDAEEKDSIKSTHYLIEVFAGLNGHGDWCDYLNDLSRLGNNLGDAWLVKMECDTIDDVWTVVIGCRLGETGTLKESALKNFVEPIKVLLLKKFLDSSFVRASSSEIGGNGLVKNSPIIGMKDSQGGVIRNYTPKQLFYLLQDKFKHLYGNKEKRDKFLKQVIIDWYNRRITKYGLLSVNSYS